MFNVISINLGFLSYCEFGLNMSRRSLRTGLSYFCGTDSFNENLISNFIIYQGFFVNNNYFFNLVDLIFPSTIYVEKNCTFINLEGRYRVCKSAIKSAIFADFEIFNGIRIFKKIKMPFNFSIISIFYDVFFYFKNYINYLNNFFIFLDSFKQLSKKMNFYFILGLDSFFLYNYIKKLVNSFFFRYINNYYNFDVFCKNSKLMANCALKISDVSFKILLK